MSRPRHVASAIVLFGIAALATWNVLNNAGWAEVVIPFGSRYRADVAGAGVLALICWAGGLGLLTRTTIGVWLGRLGAAALLALGAWLLWEGIVHPSGSTLYGDPLLIVVPVSALLVGAGIGILVALRARAGRRATAGRPGRPKA